MKLRRASLLAQARKGVKRLICKKCKKEYTPMKGDEGKGLCPKCLIEDLSNAATNPGNPGDPADEPITDTGVGQPTGPTPPPSGTPAEPVTPTTPPPTPPSTPVTTPEPVSTPEPTTPLKTPPTTPPATPGVGEEPGKGGETGGTPTPSTA